MSSPTQRIDPRGPRFTATVTLVVLAVVLLAAPAPAAVVLLVLQVGSFALGAVRGVEHTPTALVFRTLIRSRLSAPSHLEDAAPPQFAQMVGLAFALVALGGYLTGATLVGQVATGLALAAALLNAVFGFCLGCELYLLLRRVIPRSKIVNNSNTKEEVTA